MNGNINNWREQISKGINNARIGNRIRNDGKGKNWDEHWGSRELGHWGWLRMILIRSTQGGSEGVDIGQVSSVSVFCSINYLSWWCVGCTVLLSAQRPVWPLWVAPSLTGTLLLCGRGLLLMLMFFSTGTRSFTYNKSVALFYRNLSFSSI